MFWTTEWNSGVPEDTKEPGTLEKREFESFTGAALEVADVRDAWE